ncbi:prominin-like protein isoform X2 [Leptopilina boulardi]|uniref:prominin-like protein isoform X2 n=1 Tax=Leptopilina boulardi TaxID=63433 RepID=UPI0021F66199|nr:prominin-like protein isoform X2 [Leptopilina boulardi]
MVFFKMCYGLPGLFIGILTVFSLCINLTICQENFATRMRVISEDLDQQLHEMMDSQAVTYSSVNITGLPYNASTKFYPTGMVQLYNMTNMFINFVQKKQAYPEGLITTVNGEFKLADPAKEWKIIVTHYGGLAGLALAGLLLAAILPCVGLFFCCCRCAGNCGARSEPFDKKHDHCRKIMLSTILICVATVILFGVVCAFVTNEYMHDGTKQLPENMKVSLKDLRLYLMTTKKQIETLLISNFHELEITLNNILQQSGRIVTERLAEYSHAVSLMNLNDIVAGLDAIRKDLRMMNKITQDLRVNASELDIVVRGVRRNLQDTLSSCNTNACKEVLHQYKVSEMSVQVDFDKLPDVNGALDNITHLMEDNIVSEVSQGRDSFLRIQKDIQHAVNETIPVVSSSIRRAGDALESAARNITNLIDSFIFEITKYHIPGFDRAKSYIDQYSPYRYYLGLGISGILLTVLMCIIFGLFCGICGKRPDGYGDDCCDKGSGARFLMMAVWIIFLLTSILMIVTVAHMITGVAAQRGICEPLKNPKDNRMFKLLDDFVQIKRLLYPKNHNANINMSYILSACHANKTLYKVLLFENIIDVKTLRNYVERYDINNTIQELRQKIIFSPGIVIFSERARGKLNDLAQSGLSDIKFYQYAEVLRENITNINLRHLATKLREVANQLPYSYKDTKDSLEKNAHDLDHYHRDLVMPMATLGEQLSESALTLQEHIKFNHSSMSEAIHVLINEVTEAQDFLNKEGPEYVQLLASRFGEAFISQVDSFLEHVISNALSNVGKCGPVSNAYNATLVAGCNKILDPFNGFWVSVGWCLILFIPTIILCVKLSALYQKSDPYPGPLVEAEYLYDAYADRDNIPLAHVHDKKYVSHNRHHPSSYPESYEGPVSSYSDRENERIHDAHQGSSHNDSRYADVAPNFALPWQRHESIASSISENDNKVFSITLDSQNWDFPNGGPPRYQPPAAAPPLSNEYERPPPYYYPGPGERN